MADALTNTTSNRNRLSEYLTVAETAVREAGAVARQLFGKVEILGDHGTGNVFTPGDLTVNEHICNRIAAAFPHHDILSEESGHKGSGADHRWILDPIDGTRYFYSGVPLYSISLALQIENETVLGVVYNPEAEQFFSALMGSGAHLNGHRIHCSGKKVLQESTVCMEIPNRRMPEAAQAAAVQMMAKLVQRVERVRVIGASALGLCYCASGAFDLYLNVSGGSKIWDVAAGMAILKESGATIATNAESHIIGGPAELHAQLAHALESS